MKHIVLGVVMTGVMAGPVLAQEAASSRPATGVISSEGLRAAFGSAIQATAPAPKVVTVLVGADFPSLYFFRGIRQESDADFTMQPYVDFGFAASEKVTFNVGLWNSIHTGTSGSGTPDQGALYETDFYGSMTYAAGRWKSGVLFTSYNSPNDVFGTVNELAGVFTYDDSSRGLSLSPKLIIAFELSGPGADGGDHKGTYFEAGIKPGFKIGPVGIGVPLKVGTSLSNYYEGSEGDSGFGFFQTGAVATVAFPGGFEIHGGVDFYSFGTTLKEFNANDRTKVVSNIGFSVTF
jgi:hypothetical protein